MNWNNPQNQGQKNQGQQDWQNQGQQNQNQGQQNQNQGQQNWQNQGQGYQNQGQQNQGYQNDRPKKIHIGKGKPSKNQYVLANMFFNLAQIPLQWIKIRNGNSNPQVEQAFQQFMNALQGLQNAIQQGGQQFDGPTVRVCIKTLRQPDRANNTLTMYINDFVPQNQGQQNQGYQNQGQGQQQNWQNQNQGQQQNWQNQNQGQQQNWQNQGQQNQQNWG